MEAEPVGRRYLLTGTEWKGAQARILGATDLHLGREVAIKLVRDRHAGPDGRAALIQEAKWLARLRHPGIVPIYDFFEVSDGVSFVMPLLPTTIDVGNPVAEELTSCLADVARALDHCSSAGIAHRDVKPRNILRIGEGAACLCDFGIAAPLDSEAHWEGIVGSDPYIAPEAFLSGAARAEAASRAAYDQFGLGVSAYHLLTQRLPFGQAAAAEDRQARCTAVQLLKGRSFPAIHQLREDLPRGVQEVILRMLSVSPSDRFPTNVAAVEALRKALSGEAAGAVRLFLSYAREDEATVRALAAALEARHGFSVWFDQGLVGGLSWSDQIELAMEESDYMVVVLSPAASASAEVRLEWSYWMDQLRRPLLPLVLAPCRIPYRLYARQQLIADPRAPLDAALLADRIATTLPKLFEEDRRMRGRDAARAEAWRGPASPPQPEMRGEGWAPAGAAPGWEDPSWDVKTSFAPRAAPSPPMKLEDTAERDLTVIRSRGLADFATAVGPVAKGLRPDIFGLPGHS